VNLLVSVGAVSHPLAGVVSYPQHDVVAYPSLPSGLVPDLAEIHYLTASRGPYDPRRHYADSSASRSAARSPKEHPPRYGGEVVGAVMQRRGSFFE